MPPDLKVPNNAEIDQALKEFEIKSGATPQSISVSHIETDEAVPIVEVADTPKIVEFAIKYSGGFVKNRRQAEYLLLGFVFVAILITLFLFFGVINKKPKILNNSSPTIPLTITP